MRFLKEEFNIVQVLKLLALAYGIWRVEYIIKLLERL